LKYEVKSESGKIVLYLSDQLIHSDRSTFDRVVGETLSGRPGQVEVNFGGLTYMDSAGLGFLLTLREQAKKTGSAVVLADPKGTVREMLDLARFDTLFSIRQTV